MVAPWLLKLTTLVPVPERPAKGLVFASCSFAVVAGITDKVEVPAAVFVVCILPATDVVPPVTVKAAFDATLATSDDVRAILLDKLRLLTDDVSVWV